MNKPLVNYAFIDAQNLHKSLAHEGLEIDYPRFRRYLKEKYAVHTAYMFMGYIPWYGNLYQFLKQAEFELVFKPTIPIQGRKMKGNCDAELVLQAMKDWKKYEKAFIVSGDGDFYCLVKHLLDNNKLGGILAPSPQRCCKLYKGIFPKINYVSLLKKVLIIK